MCTVRYPQNSTNYAGMPGGGRRFDSQVRSPNSDDSRGKVANYHTTPHPFARPRRSTLVEPSREHTAFHRLTPAHCAQTTALGRPRLQALHPSASFTSTSSSITMLHGSPNHRGSLNRRSLPTNVSWRRNDSLPGPSPVARASSLNRPPPAVSWRRGSDRESAAVATVGMSDSVGDFESAAEFKRASFSAGAAFRGGLRRDRISQGQPVFAHGAITVDSKRV
jgi:hypothetical protein